MILKHLILGAFASLREILLFSRQGAKAQSGEKTIFFATPARPELEGVCVRRHGQDGVSQKRPTTFGLRIAGCLSQTPGDHEQEGQGHIPHCHNLRFVE
jgi:hypothetical protein